MINKKHFSTFLILLALLMTPSMDNLTDLLQTDTNGTLLSHMFLAAIHDYSVSPDGIVTIDGRRYAIWPEVHEIA